MHLKLKYYNTDCMVGLQCNEIMMIFFRSRLSVQKVIKIIVLDKNEQQRRKRLVTM